MTYIELRCECGGRVTFGPDDRSPTGLGVLGRCDCGTGYRLAGGRVMSFPSFVDDLVPDYAGPR